LSAHDKQNLENVADGDLIAALTARLARSEASTAADWIEEFRTGEVLLAGEAAAIASTSDDTVRRRLAEAKNRGERIGLCFAGVWFVSLRWLLADIERRFDPHERLAAESRARKVIEMRSTPHI
jgi:hypothetical protein